jgi:hypothetical protein
LANREREPIVYSERNSVIMSWRAKDRKILTEQIRFDFLFLFSGPKLEYEKGLLIGGLSSEGKIKATCGSQ